MEFKDKPLTISVISLITMIFFIITTTITMYWVYSSIEKRVTIMEKEMWTKASMNEIDKINIKLWNIEAMVQEIRIDLKSIK